LSVREVTMTEKHELMGGKLHVYRRENSGCWQCSTYLAGKNWRVSTKEDSLAHAKDFAQDWYLGLVGKNRAGVLKVGKTFKQAAELFLQEYEVITEGERHPRYINIIEGTLRVHLLPFLGSKVVSEITPGLVQEYRIHRMTARLDKKTGEPKRPARATMRSEVVVLRQVLKAAYRHGWLQYMPDLSAPYKASGKIAHRAWFSPEEYKMLYEATRAETKAVQSLYRKYIREQFHDYVLFMANTGLRPDESARLEFRDVAIVTDEATGERILEIEVRGKRGVGYCKSMAGAVIPFERLQKRSRPPFGTRRKRGEPRVKNMPGQMDKIFGQTPADLLNAVLTKLNLKFDRDGNRRSAYSLRHTYICLRLMEGADIYQIAKNCRTSVEMIETFYASHIKNTLDAAAINVRKPRPMNKPTSNPEDEA
jgi:integrase